MSEDVNLQGDVQNVDTSSDNAIVNPQLTDSVNPEPENFDNSKKTGIRTFTRDTFNKLMKESHERGAKEALSGINNQNPVDSKSIEEFTKHFDKHIEDKIAERLQFAKQNEEAHNIAKNFYGKLGNSNLSEKYPDYSEAIKSLNIPNMSQIVEQVADMENTDEIMYQLATNPSKIASLEILFSKQPELAKKELKNLSESLKANSKAMNSRQPNSPLSHIRNSINTVNNSNGGDDNVDPDYFRNYYRNNQ